MEIANKNHFCKAVNDAGRFDVGEGEIHIAIDCIIKNEQVQFSPQLAAECSAKEMAMTLEAFISTQFDEEEQDRIKTWLAIIWKGKDKGAIKQASISFTEGDYRQEGFQEGLENLIKEMSK